MVLSQLLKIMNRDERIIVNNCEAVPLTHKCLYSGQVRGIYKDSPLNKGDVKFLMAAGDDVLVEISLKKSEGEG